MQGVYNFHNRQLLSAFFSDTLISELSQIKSMQIQQEWKRKAMEN